LADDINTVADSGRRFLRPAADRTRVVARTRNTYGDKTFAAAGMRECETIYRLICDSPSAAGNSNDK